MVRRRSWEGRPAPQRLHTSRRWCSPHASPADAAVTLVRARDGGGVASHVDEQAEANARWLVACAPTVPGQPPVVHVEAPGQGIPFEPIRRALRRDASTEIAQCVATARTGQPELKGAVLVRFVAAPDGTLTEGRVLVGPGNDTFHACLVDALQKPKVPKVTEGNLTLSSVPVVLCADGRRAAPASRRAERAVRAMASTSSRGRGRTAFLALGCAERARGGSPVMRISGRSWSRWSYGPIWSRW